MKHMKNIDNKKLILLHVSITIAFILALFHSTFINHNDIVFQMYVKSMTVFSIILFLLLSLYFLFQLVKTKLYKGKGIGSILSDMLLYDFFFLMEVTSLLFVITFILPPSLILFYVLLYGFLLNLGYLICCLILLCLFYIFAITYDIESQNLMF